MTKCCCEWINFWKPLLTIFIIVLVVSIGIYVSVKRINEDIKEDLCCQNRSSCSEIKLDKNTNICYDLLNWSSYPALNKTYDLLNKVNSQ